MQQHEGRMAASTSSLSPPHYPSHCSDLATSEATLAELAAVRDALRREFADLRAGMTS